MEKSAPSRYRVNPIEAVLLTAVALVFCHSIYDLAADYQNLQAAPLGSGYRASNEVNHGTADRAPAATKGSTFRSIEFTCAPEPSQSAANDDADDDTTPGTQAQTATETEIPISASKIRLAGPLCGSPSPETPLLKAAVIYGANKNAATVFTDLSAQKFSTDYIPLVPGRNSVHVEFTYQGGKTYSHDLAFERN
jgi:hypothetical protein